MRLARSGARRLRRRRRTTAGATRQARRSRSAIAALGDSITAGNPNYDPDPRARRALGFGDDPRSQYEYWAHRDDPRLRVRNCGIFGQTTAQIATRLRSCARGADALIVQGGINDIAQSLRSPAPVRRTAVNRRGGQPGADGRAGKQLGLRVAIAEVLPWNRGYPVAAPLIERLNRLIGVNAKLRGGPGAALRQGAGRPEQPPADAAAPDRRRRPSFDRRLPAPGQACRRALRLRSVG